MIRRLVLAAGAAVAVSMPVLGQDTDPNRPARPPAQPQPTDVVPRAPQPLSADTASILREREGVWRVEVDMKADLWRPGRSPRPGAERADQNEPPLDAGRQPADRQLPPSEADMVRLEGFAETNLAIGGSVLCERIVLAGPGVKPADTIGARNMPDAFQGISLLGFDEGADRYTIAIAGSHYPGRIHHGSGSFDTQQRRIVFEGMGGSRAMDMMRPSHEPGKMEPGTPHQPGHTPETGDRRPGQAPDQLGDMDSRQPPGRSPAMPMHDRGVRVVLEVLDQDHHRVTMYRGSGPEGLRPATPNEPNRKNQPARPEQPGRAGEQAGAEQGTVIYRATYTRASGQEESNIRGMLQREFEPPRTTTPR